MIPDFVTIQKAGGIYPPLFEYLQDFMASSNKKYLLLKIKIVQYKFQAAV